MRRDRSTDSSAGGVPSHPQAWEADGGLPARAPPARNRLYAKEDYLGAPGSTMRSRRARRSRRRSPLASGGANRSRRWAAAGPRAQGDGAGGGSSGRSRLRRAERVRRRRRRPPAPPPAPPEAALTPRPTLATAQPRRSPSTSPRRARGGVPGILLLAAAAGRIDASARGVLRRGVAARMTSASEVPAERDEHDGAPPPSPCRRRRPRRR